MKNAKPVKWKMDRWGFVMGFRGLASFILVAGIVSAASARAETAVTVKIPCDADPWMKCADVTKKLLEAPATATFPGGLTALTRELLDAAYVGKMRLAKSAVDPANCVSYDNMNKPPICSPLKIPENGCVDESVNAYKVPEGSSAKCPAISKVGAATNDNPLFILGKSDLGSLESSNMAAGLPMAISNQSAEIRKEIAVNGLQVGPSSPCFSQAKSLASLIATQSDVKLLSRITNCDVTGDPNQSLCSARQYFNGTVDAIFSGYIQLVRCRLVDESSKKFTEFTMDPGSPRMKPYSDVLHDLFVQQCFYPYRGDPNAMRACYAKKYADWIGSRARTMFPNVAAACR